MKAVFKLTPEQIEQAIEAQDVTRATLLAAVEDNYDGLINCGLYCVTDEPHTNTNQAVYLERGFLVVEGERCALAGDDGYEVAMCIVGEDAVPTRYETSDPRLKWNETLAEYMKARAPLDARVAYVLAGRHHEWRWFIPEYEACVAYLQTNPKKAYAQYDAYTISVCRQIVKETT